MTRTINVTAIADVAATVAAPPASRSSTCADGLSSIPIRSAAEHWPPTARLLLPGAIKVLDEAPKARLAPTNFICRWVPYLISRRPRRARPCRIDPGLLLWGEAGSAINHLHCAARSRALPEVHRRAAGVQEANGEEGAGCGDRQGGGRHRRRRAGRRQGPSRRPARAAPTGSRRRRGVLRSSAFPPAAGGGKINPGLLTIEFRAGDKPGLYRPIVELIGGNSYRFTPGGAMPAADQTPGPLAQTCIPVGIRAACRCRSGRRFACRWWRCACRWRRPTTSTSPQRQLVVRFGLAQVGLLRHWHSDDSRIRVGDREGKAGRNKHAVQSRIRIRRRHSGSGTRATTGPRCWKP